MKTNIDSGQKRRLQTITKISEKIRQFRSAADSHPRYSDDRRWIMIPEITGRFPQTSEDFPTATKVLGNFKEFGRLKGKFLRDYKLHSESYDYRDGSPSF